MNTEIKKTFPPKGSRKKNGKPEAAVPERLQKVLAGAGVASRRQAEKMIEQGRVKVNGQVVAEQGQKITRHDRVEIDGKKVNLKTGPFVYMMMHKPVRILSTVKDEHGRKTVMDLLPKDAGRVYPVGRLDYETSGLLLLTNDGDLTLKLTHPRYSVPKTYKVRLDKALTQEDRLSLRRGVELDDGPTRPADLKILPSPSGAQPAENWVEITLYEGRNRQVRRMFEQLDYQVLTLTRTAYAALQLKELPAGSCRRLTPREVDMLKRLTQASAARWQRGRVSRGKKNG